MGPAKKKKGEKKTTTIIIPEKQELCKLDKTRLIFFNKIKGSHQAISNFIGQPLQEAFIS